MRKLVLSGVIAAVGLALPATANAGVILTAGTIRPISGLHDFQTQLGGLSLTQYTTTGADLFVDSTSTITFQFLGSESGFNDTFAWLGTTPGSNTEFTSFTNNFGSSVLIGASVFDAGSLAGRLTFASTNPNGATATVGSDGFGIFLGPNPANGPLSVFYLGYDDQITGQDDDHDDFIVRATVVPGAVPEPATWAMMLTGFAGLGFFMRRRRAPASTRVAVSSSNPSA